jgi:nucleotide-binding universal stress UspA family protein
MGMYRKILLPIDIADTALSEPGIAFAARLVAMTSGTVRLIHVFPELPTILQELLAPQAIATQEEAAEKKLQELAEHSAFPEGRFSHTFRTGPVYAEVLAEAEDWGADLVVIGSHSPSMSTYLLGSNAQKIVRHANCSVLVVRPHKEAVEVYATEPAVA